MSTDNKEAIAKLLQAIKTNLEQGYNVNSLTTKLKTMYGVDLKLDTDKEPEVKYTAPTTKLYGHALERANICGDCNDTLRHPRNGSYHQRVEDGRVISYCYKCAGLPVA